ncbi:MAG: COG1361 S-layer family protein [Candidatus Diapherotrites archaeon]|nr:COG1361 S-layer family protein [Candidatus Diapherotrites archaeon]
MKKSICPVIIILTMLMSISVVHADLSDIAAISINLVNQDPDPAIAGGTVEVRFEVTNSGGNPATNMMLELKPIYPFELFPEETSVKNIGTIMAYQGQHNTKIVKYKLKVDKDAIAGNHELKLKSYSDNSSEMITKLSLSVKSKENAEIIHIDKTTLVPGKQDTLKFTINNVGAAPLRDIIFSWINEDKIILPVGSDNTKHIKYIDVGESAELDYQIIADSNAEAGLYELKLQLSYDGTLSGNEQVINTIAGIYVGGKTDFDVAFSEISSEQTLFTVANIGSNPAFSVSVIIPQQPDWKITGSNSMIIGNLNKGDYTIANFSLQSTQSLSSASDLQEKSSVKEQKTQPPNVLKVQIAYTDTMGTRQLIEKQLPINQQTLMILNDSSKSTTGFSKKGAPQPTSPDYTLYFAAIVILAAVAVVYLRHKKKGQ